MFGPSNIFQFEEFRFDPRGLFRREDNGGFAPVKIGSRALDILRLLVERAGDVVSKEDIFAAVWPNTVVEDGNLTTQISALRRVLSQSGGAEQTCIQTVAGRGYRFVGRIQRSETDVAGSASSPRLSIVVLPFASLSLHPEHEYFADAIIDDLTAGLSRINYSAVVARTTAFSYKGKAIDVREVAHELGVHYVIEGSVRRQSDRVQVNAQLINGETGSHVWADRFDSDLSDPAESQTAIVSRLTTTLTRELIKDTGRRIEQGHAADLDARDLVLSATALRLQTSLADRHGRRTISARLERALILDPHSVEARIQLAHIFVSDVTDAYSTSIEQDKARAETLISEALARDPHNSEAHRIMGQLRRTQGRWAESRVHLETAIALDPNNVVALRQLGLILRSLGKPEAAIPYLEKAIRDDADHRSLFHSYTQLGNCHLYLGHTDLAIEFYRKARALAPEIWYVHFCLGAALALGGDIDDAKMEIAEAVKLKPEVNSITQWRAIASTQGFSNPQNRALVEKTIYTGLRLAGFPEE